MNDDDRDDRADEWTLTYQIACVQARGRQIISLPLRERASGRFHNYIRKIASAIRNRFIGCQPHLSAPNRIGVCLFVLCNLSVAAQLSGPLRSAEGKKMQPTFSKLASFVEDDDVSSMDFSPDGSELAVGTFQTLHINVWDWQKSKVKMTMSKPPVNFDLASGNGIRYSPDGSLLAVVHGLSSEEDGRGVVSIFDVSKGAIVHTISEPQGGGEYSKIAFSPDGKTLYRTYDSPKSTSQFTAYSTATWDQLAGLSGFPLEIVALAVSEDGKFAALGGFTPGPNISKQGSVVIIELTHYSTIRVIKDCFPVPNRVLQLAWHPDGTRIAAGAMVGGSSAGTDAVRIFDSKNGAVVAREEAKTAKVLALRYAADGKVLIESGIDNSVLIWDGQHSHMLKRIDQKANAIAVSRNGSYLAISDGRKVSILDLR